MKAHGNKNKRIIISCLILKPSSCIEIFGTNIQHVLSVINKIGTAKLFLDDLITDLTSIKIDMAVIVSDRTLPTPSWTYHMSIT